MTERYHNFLVNNPLMAAIKLSRYKFVAKLLRGKDAVLDVGCNDGVSTNFFSKFVSTAVGIDSDGSKIREAGSLFPGIEFHCTDVLAFRPERKFDAIILLDFIEHFPKATGEKILRRYTEFLGPGGIVVVGTPNKQFERFRSQESRNQHVYEYDPGELEALMDTYFQRTLTFSMNDEVVHTGNVNLAWFLFSIGLYPQL